MVLSEEAKKARREYMRKWQRENKDKVRKNQAAYWDRKAKEAHRSEAAGGSMKNA